MVKFFSDAFKVFYDGFNPGTHTIGCTITLSKSSADVTAFGDVAEKGIVAVRQDSIDWAGLFDDDAQALDAGATLLGTAGRVISVIIGSGTGSRLYAGTAIYVAAHLGGRKGEAAPMSARFTVEGAWGTGQLLMSNPPVEYGSGTAATGPNVDGGAATTNGGYFVVHILSTTGTRRVTLNDSADGTNFVTIATFASADAAKATSTLIAITGTIRRYTRWDFSENLNGTFRFVAGVLRS